MLDQVLLYFTLFIMAATPWLEILIVIPIGIGLGLHPIIVAIVTFIGNALPVFLIVYLYDWFRDWRLKRKKSKNVNQQYTQKVEINEGLDNHISHEKVVEGESLGKSSDQSPSKKSKRREKAMRILKKYGVPGLAFIGPLVTGIHLAVIISLTVRPSKAKLLFWMNISLALWTIAITIASVYGIEWLLSFV